MNKHILLVMKWLDDKNSVTQKELGDNRTANDANDANEATYATYAAAYVAEKWIGKYFDRSGDDKQSYIDALKPKLVYTQAMADNGELPDVGVKVSMQIFENLTSIGHIEFKNDIGFLFRYEENNLCDFFECSEDISFKPLTPTIELIDGEAYQFDIEFVGTVCGVYYKGNHEFNGSEDNYEPEFCANIKLLTV